MKTHLITAISAVSAVALFAAAGAQAQSWSGPYVGASIRSASLSQQDEALSFDTNLDGGYGDTVKTYQGHDAFAPGFCDGYAITTSPADGCFGDREKPGIGLRAGYDWQFGSVVVGIVADVDNARYEDSVSGFQSDPTLAPASYVFTREVENLSAVRLRAGYAMEPWLVYATGGVARADISRSFTSSNGLNSFTASDGDNGDGNQWGLGIEKRYGSWAFGLEYLKTTIDDAAPVVRAGPTASTFASNAFLRENAAGTDIRRGSDAFESESVVFTVSYRFGGL